MRVTVIPAEVTSVEDKILGNFSVKQTALVALAILGTVFLSTSTTGIGTTATISPIVVLWVVCLGLALRIKGTTVLDYSAIIGRYVMRPRYYVYDRRSATGRRVIVPERQVTKARAAETKVDGSQVLTPTQAIALDQTLNDPTLALQYHTDKKGKLYVRITKTIN